MMKDLKSRMMASISEVLETMFYMPLEFDDYGDVNKLGLLDTPDLRLCIMDFSGKFKGRFVMMIPETLLINMARDFMGEERKNINRQHSDGIIKEVLNMVAGHMFSNMDNKSEFHLGIPEIVEDHDIILKIKENTPEGLVVAECIDGFILSVIQLNE